MKINKKECRKFADPGTKMQLSSGLLHAEQIKYVIRTAVRIIDRHKILILYIHTREKAAQGDFKPCMTMFHCQDDFMTLEHRDDDSTVWRTSAFNHLDVNWSLSSKSAFYSSKDEERVRKYFKSDKSGFMPLIIAQNALLEHRRLKRQRNRENRILDRMAGVKSLPRCLNGWIRRSVMPGYFFCDYKRGIKDVPGVCSACGREIKLSGVKQGAKLICPHCRKELTAKPRSRRGSNMYDRKTCQVIQRISDSELVIRIVKVYYSYHDDIPKVRIYENARQFIFKNPDGRICAEAYYYSYNNGFLMTHWKKGERPKYSQWQECYEADTCGYVYTQTLLGELAGTPWQYCPVAEYYNYWHEPMESLPFLAAYLNHPRMEHLVKNGFYSIVSDIVYRYNNDCIDESRNRTHQILGVAAEDVDFLRGININAAALRIFQQYAGIKDRQKLLMWQIENQVEYNVLPILQHMTVHKAVKYLDSQYGFLRLRKTKYGAQRYKDMQELVTEYKDYLEMCRKLGYDMKNSFVKFPKDIQEAHDKAAKSMKHKANAIMRREFAAVYKSIAGKYDFEKSGMKIVYPKNPDDVVKEGNTLHHCVGGYTERVADRKCIILFLRRCSDLQHSYYTIELQENKVVQVRGVSNCSATPEVDKFIKAWEKRVLTRINTAA